MTDAEFELIRQEVAERKERTSFPAIDPRDDYEAHSHHAEYASAAH